MFTSIVTSRRMPNRPAAAQKDNALAEKRGFRQDLLGQGAWVFQIVIHDCVSSANCES